MAYAGHVLGGSSGICAVLVLGCKINGVTTRSRPRRKLDWIWSHYRMD